MVVVAKRHVSFLNRPSSSFVLDRAWVAWPRGAPLQLTVKRPRTKDDDEDEDEDDCRSLRDGWDHRHLPVSSADPAAGGPFLTPRSSASKIYESLWFRQTTDN
jgi:hypothetical protein